MRDDAVDRKVVECFGLVFGDRTDDELIALTTDDAEWDSLASLSLIGVLEEEFDIRLPDDVVAGMTSVPAAQQAVRDLLEDRLSA